MSLFSFLRKNKQESASDNSAFHSRSEEDSQALRSRTKRRRGGKGDEAADPVLPEKKRARRRLIGAVALVLAAVIGLPMVLDSEPKPIGDDVVIQIPSKDKPAPAAPVPPAAPTPATQGPDSVSAVASLDEKEEMVEPKELVKTEGAESAPVEPAVRLPDVAADTGKPDASRSQAIEKPLPAAPVVAKVETKVEQPGVEASRSGQVDEAARARAILEGRPDPKAEDKKDSGKFVIQVAALATKEGVNELQARLKEAGIRSYTQKVMTEAGDRTRIRVGPFGSRDEAEKVRARIVKLGLNGTLVPV